MDDDPDLRTVSRLHSRRPFNLVKHAEGEASRAIFCRFQAAPRQ
jgi:hypothetical protein